MRVLVVSNVRPARARRLALRIAEEVPGASVCGIVQRPLRHLPLIQQRIAAGKLADGDALPSAWQRIKRWVQMAGEEVAHRLLWLAHGCPRGCAQPETFTVARLAQECSTQGWPLREAAALTEEVLQFIRRTAPDLILILGVFSGVFAWAFPSRGLLQIMETQDAAGDGLQIAIEHYQAHAGAGSILASLNLLPQVEDGILGFTLKADLIADDLLVQAVAALRAGGAAQAAEQMSGWVREILSPYLAQLPQSRATSGRQPSHAFRRSRFWLCLESLLLLSPFVLGRNWLRRRSSGYPVLILAYHLVSDRGHRMGISTEKFWRQVRFLQRHYRIVNLAEAVRLLRSGVLAVPTLVLTFDDGYADNFVSLRAVAEETGVPVSVFLTTRPVSMRTEFQHDVAKGARGAFPMTWSQVRYWSRRGAEFGSHTRTHADCGTSESALLQEEIAGAKTDMERELGTQVSFFAFPYGKHETMSEEAKRIARSMYGHFLSSFGGENLPRGTQEAVHLLRKPAYTEPWELELDLQSVFDFVGAVKRFLSRRRAGTPGSPERSSLVESAARLNDALVARGQEVMAGCEVPMHQPTTPVNIAWPRNGRRPS